MAKDIAKIEKAIRLLFEMPEAPTKINNLVCIHCVMMSIEVDLCSQFTNILREGGVNPEALVSMARRGGVTNIKFENGQIMVPRGVETVFGYPGEPNWHRMINFEYLMELVVKC